jgi:two-component system sensor histidine kinase/response regulator
MTKVLIIEDDELLREVYSTKLKMEGFNVETAVNGQEGLDKARTLEPDVILVDMLMPKMTGLEFLQAYRPHALKRRVTTIVISNKSSPKDINQAKTMGARDYLIKSQLTPHEIVTKVRRYLQEEPGATSDAA